MLLYDLFSLALFSVAAAIPTAVREDSIVDARTSKNTACVNGPSTRNCWSAGYDLSTDYDTAWPNGKRISYHLEITNMTVAPDGTPRIGMVVNGQYPGPPIVADWGDTLHITVINSLQDNGTSMHWHGMRQFQSNNMDGTNGVTECPLPPGHSKAYTFTATQYGTSWYHSHFSAQYGDGVLGAIVINGPASANYDVDLGPMLVSDWYYLSASQESEIATHGFPPTADNGLINGTMVSPSGKGGAYNTVKITKGKTYRLRLINTSVDNHFKVHLDGHKFTVIQTDFVPIVPYTADWLFMGIGQRYDVVFTADQSVDNYWFRAEVQSNVGCGNNANNGNIKSIFTYDGAKAGNPTTTGTPYAQSCLDDPQQVPFLKKDVPSGGFLDKLQPLNTSLDTTGVPGSPSNVVHWEINGVPLNVDWNNPTLKYIANGNHVFPPEINLIKLPNANDYYYWIIQSTGFAGAPHPIHLHGHDFFILGAGQGAWNPSLASTLNFKNPPRRDVAMLPGSNAAGGPPPQGGGGGGGPPPAPPGNLPGGWLVIAFLTDNPGAWLLHCHIAWHVGEGLAVQFLERENEIEGIMDLNTLDAPCRDWDGYKKKMYYPKDDSGL